MGAHWTSESHRGNICFCPVAQVPCSQQCVHSQRNSPGLQNHPKCPIFSQKPMRSSLATFFFLELHLWDVEVPRLGVELELQLPTYTTATEMWDPSCVCDLWIITWIAWIMFFMTCLFPPLAGEELKKTAHDNTRYLTH